MGKGRGNMNFDDAYRELDLKFTSGNRIPVERATITVKEWEAIKAELFRLDQIEEIYEEQQDD